MKCVDFLFKGSLCHHVKRCNIKSVKRDYLSYCSFSINHTGHSSLTFLINKAFLPTYSTCCLLDVFFSSFFCTILCNLLRLLFQEVCSFSLVPTRVPKATITILDVVQSFKKAMLAGWMLNAEVKSHDRIRDVILCHHKKGAKTCRFFKIYFKQQHIHVTFKVVETIHS